jgi:hypothetical protein
MYLSKEHPPKIRHHAENRRCGQGKTLPHKRKKLVYGMEDSQETMTKVIDRLLGPEGSYLALGV